MKKQISNQMDGGLIAKENFETFKLESVFDQKIIDDLSLVLHNKWTFDQYTDYVHRSKSEKYLGIDKIKYESAVRAFQTIVELALRKKQAIFNQAIVFLHQELKISPVTIQIIAQLFGRYIPIETILEISSEAFMKKEKPLWLVSIINKGYYVETKKPEELL